MSFSAAAVYAQPLVRHGTGQDADCDPYPAPIPTAVITNLDTPSEWRLATAVETNLCSEIE